MEWGLPRSDLWVTRQGTGLPRRRWWRAPSGSGHPGMGLGLRGMEGGPKSVAGRRSYNLPSLHCVSGVGAGRGLEVQGRRPPGNRF